MSSASIEQTLDLWSTELSAVKARIQSLFSHASVVASAAAFLDGLLGPERRKTGWMRAEAAGDAGPSPQAIPRRDSPQSGLKGGSRRCWGAAAGRPMSFAIWCATMPSRPWRRRMRCW